MRTARLYGAGEWGMSGNGMASDRQERTQGGQWDDVWADVWEHGADDGLADGEHGTGFACVTCITSHA
jgi:hypothetical protein